MNDVYPIGRVQEILAVLSNIRKFRIVHILYRLPDQTGYPSQVARILGLNPRYNSTVKQHLRDLQKLGILGAYRRTKGYTTAYYFCITGKLREWLFSLMEKTSDMCPELQIDIKTMNEVDHMPKRGARPKGKICEESDLIFD